MLSLPGGSVIVIVRIHGPVPGHAALPRVTAFAPSWLVLNAVTCAGVMLGLVVVFSVNTIFDVDDDTYAGRRLVPLVVGTGTVILNVASASGPEYSGAAIADGTGG